MCAFCVVPFTRGRERSRDPESIYKECVDLYNQNYKEVILLGQNVDSYKFEDADGHLLCNFAQLLEKIALIAPDLRIRFSSSHPKDITDEVLHTIVKYNNICNHIHYPVQSGNSRVLKAMNRTYDVPWLKARLEKIREIIPDCGISTDVIAGFCTETEQEHQDTLAMFEWAQFDFAYMYQYSERPGTLAARKFTDDVPEEVKHRRLKEIIDVQHRISIAKNKTDIGKLHTVLIEGFSKKSEADYAGRNNQNKTVIFPVGKGYGKGDYVKVLAEKSTQTSLIGKVVEVLKHP
jgi:tRNA-2-methylthio-N6-dimethylallyladenosine synthase